MIVVDKETRGKGIGKQLVRRYMTDIAARGDCVEICLETECINTTALKLYEGEIISDGIFPREET